MDQNSLLTVLALFVLLFQSASSASVGGDNSIKKDLTPRGSEYQEKIKEFKYIVSGFDYEYRPVIIMNWGKWDVIWLANHTNEKNQVIKNFEQLIEEIDSGVFVRKFDKFLPIGSNYTNNQFVIILNYYGFDFRTTYNPAAAKLILRMLAEMQGIIVHIAYGVVINANPVVNQVLAMAKPLAGNFLAKFDIYGSNSDKWIPRIRTPNPITPITSCCSITSYQQRRIS
ncbi:unnamed protein product [Allacma fusca]|uniref:Uncharacterized protein n=1 Tax=Allacma fusca TaxID=39272 RepID=A0A8J2L518_9HEXA|nr:unnamed protein product [Allacma fusca]